MRRNVGADHLAEQRRLVADVVVEHRLVDAGAARDLVHPGAAEAALREDLRRRIQDALPGFAGRCARDSMEEP